jgi:hypothetical protein
MEITFQGHGTRMRFIDTMCKQSCNFLISFMVPFFLSEGEGF